jgi:hypothetical protein
MIKYGNGHWKLTLPISYCIFLEANTLKNSKYFFNNEKPHLYLHIVHKILYPAPITPLMVPLTFDTPILFR